MRRWILQAGPITRRAHAERVLGALYLSLLLLAAAGFLGAQLAHAGRPAACAARPCEASLPATDGRWRTWVSPFRLAPGEASINVFSASGPIAFRAAGDCGALFAGRGVRLRARICEPGLSHLRLRYRSPEQLLIRVLWEG